MGYACAVGLVLLIIVMVVNMIQLAADVYKRQAPYKDNVVESRLDIYGKDGKYYGFPTHVGTTVAFYNDCLLYTSRCV